MAKKPKAVRAHKEDGTFKADDPSTLEVNEAFVESKKALPGPTTGYRDNKEDGTVEAFVFVGGFLPKGWKDTWAGLKNDARTKDDSTRPKIVYLKQAPAK